MSEGNGLSPLQLTLITGTLLIANLAAFWFIRKNIFTTEKGEGEKEKKFKGILDIEEWNEFELIEKEIITHNTAIYRFKLPTTESVLPLPIGQVKKESRYLCSYLLIVCVFVFLARSIVFSLE